MLDRPDDDHDSRLSRHIVSRAAQARGGGGGRHGGGGLYGHGMVRFLHFFFLFTHIYACNDGPSRCTSRSHLIIHTRT